jgi:hypothetical protein
VKSHLFYSKQKVKYFTTTTDEHDKEIGTLAGASPSSWAMSESSWSVAPKVDVLPFYLSQPLTSKAAGSWYQLHNGHKSSYVAARDVERVELYKAPAIVGICKPHSTPAPTPPPTPAPTTSTPTALPTDVPTKRPPPTPPTPRPTLLSGRFA